MDNLTFCVRCSENKHEDNLVEYQHEPVCTECITENELVELGLK